MACRLLLILLGCFSNLQVLSSETIQAPRVVEIIYEIRLSNLEILVKESLVQATIPDINVCDSVFYIPTVKEFKKFNSDFFKWLKNNHLETPSHSLDCDKYTMAFKLFSSMQYHKGKFGGKKILDTMQAEAESVAIGEVQYKLDEKDKAGHNQYHAINFVILRDEDSKENKVVFLFYDPQKLSFVKLSPSEVLSIYHVRI